MSQTIVAAEPLSDTAVRLTCEIKASPDRVYSAWTDARQMERWFAPEPGSVCTVHQLDVEIGGKFRISVTHSGGTSTAAGTYTRLDRPDRISFSWYWETSGADGVTSQITLDFVAIETGTRLVMTHERLADVESRDLHTQGWTGCLTTLADYLRSSEGRTDLA